LQKEIDKRRDIQALYEELQRDASEDDNPIPNADTVCAPEGPYYVLTN
jgi:hypothetical protein